MKYTPIDYYVNQEFTLEIVGIETEILVYSYFPEDESVNYKIKASTLAVALIEESQEQVEDIEAELVEKVKEYIENERERAEKEHQESLAQDRLENEHREYYRR